MKFPSEMVPFRGTFVHFWEGNHRIIVLLKGFGVPVLGLGIVGAKQGHDKMRSPPEPRKKKKKKRITFHYTGWLIGILIMVYYNPYTPGGYNPLYNPTNQGPFFPCSPGSKAAMKTRVSLVSTRRNIWNNFLNTFDISGQITMYFLNLNVFGAFWGVLAY